jgi:hypothetical protein
MTLAIMQPYLFPYIGYFQLLRACDRFIVYDDVNYIKGGWINRNRWLVQGQPAYFTFPVADVSSFRRISDVDIDPRGKWQKKLIKTFRINYAKAPFFETAHALLAAVVASSETRIAIRAEASLQSICDYVGLNRPFTRSSTMAIPGDLHGTERVLHICRAEGASRYVNAQGGMELYDKAAFAQNEIELRFLRPRPIRYQQLGGEFVPWLSILDVVAFNPPDAIRRYLTEFDLE